MDALALLAAGPMTGAVPTDGQTAPGVAPSAVAGDAFAAVFATALGSEVPQGTPVVPASAIVASGTVPLVPAVPAVAVAPAPQSVRESESSKVTPVLPALVSDTSLKGESTTAEKAVAALPSAPEPTAPQVALHPEVNAEAVAAPDGESPKPASTDTPAEAQIPSSVVPEKPVDSEKTKPAQAGPKAVSAPSVATPLETSEAEPTPVTSEPVPADEGLPASLPADARGKAPEKVSAPETNEASVEPAPKTSAKTRVSRTAESASKPVPKGKATARLTPMAQETETNVPAPLNVPAAPTPVAAPTSVALDIASNTTSTVDGPAVESSITLQGATAPASLALPAAPDLRAVPTIIVGSAPAPVTPQETAKPPVASSPETVVAAVPNARIAQVAERASAGPSPKLETSEGDKVGEVKPSADSSVLIVSPKMGEKASEDGPQDERGGGQETPFAQPDAASNGPGVARTAATERPEAGENRPAVDRHLVVRQVADRIESLVAARPKDGVTIHLEPQDLGTVTLVVKGLSSALDVQVSASDDRVRQSLDASRPELAQALAPRGIELRELRVATPHAPPSTSSSTDSGSGGRAGGQQPQQQPRSQNPNPSFVRSARSEPAPARRAARSSGRGVDLLV